MRSILLCLRQSGLTAKPSKCQYGMQYCVYLCHIVGSGTLKPVGDKLIAVTELPASFFEQNISESFP